jgi:hypothetical protein
MFRRWQYILVLSCVACELMAGSAAQAADVSSFAAEQQSHYVAAVLSQQHAIDAPGSLRMAADECSDTHAVDLFVPFFGNSVTLVDGQATPLIFLNVTSGLDQTLVARRIRLQI